MSYENYEKEDLIDLVKSLNQRLSHLSKDAPSSYYKESLRKQIRECRQLRVRNNLLEREFARIASDYDDILINKSLLPYSKEV